MLSFRQWLLEYVAFAKGRDVDFTASNAIVFFSKEGKASYREEGRTHGEYSHAVKHYMEFQPGNALGFAAEIKGIVQKWEKEGGLDFIELVDENGRTLARGWNQVNQLARPLDWLCSLDYINDITLTKGRLTKLEVEIRRVGDKMRKLYDQEIVERMKKAVSLDSMQANEIARLCRSNSIISFKANRNEEYYLDLKDNAMAIVRNGEVATFFKFSRKGQQNETIATFLRKKPYLNYANKEVIKGFEMATNR
jgi:hypothetical protein